MKWIWISKHFSLDMYMNLIYIYMNLRTLMSGGYTFILFFPLEWNGSVRVYGILRRVIQMPLFRTKTLHPVARNVAHWQLMQSASQGIAFRCMLAALPSLSPFLGSDCIQWLVILQHKCMSHLTQFWTVLKGHTSLRAPQGIAAAFVPTTTALQPNFCLCLISLPVVVVSEV